MSQGRSLDLYFDPTPPPPPIEIFGFSTDLIFQLATSLQGLQIATDQLSSDGRIIEGAVELFPLLQRVQSDEVVSPNDVRPYRRSIKKVVPGMETVNEIMTALTVIPPLGIVGKIALNKAIEREFVRRVPEAVEKATEYIPRALPYVELFENFDNPRQQFVEELTLINGAIINLITERSKTPRPRHAAEAIKQAFNDYVVGGQELPIPMTRGVLAVQVEVHGEFKLPEDDTLDLIAPDALGLLSAPVPKDSRMQTIMDSVSHYQANMESTVPHIRSEELRAFKKAAPKILPLVRDLLPTRGYMIRQSFEEARRFLNA